jgi:hypothetical protein
VLAALCWFRVAAGLPLKLALGIMKSFEVSPLVGVGSVKLGMAQAKVHAVMGQPLVSFKKVPTSRHPTDAWLQNGFQVFYGGSEPVVEFIELSRGCGFEAVCFEQRILSTPALAVVEQLKVITPFDPTNCELGYSYVFPEWELSLWRPDIEEPEGRYFATVGIGCRGYFSGAHDAQQKGIDRA